MGLSLKPEERCAPIFILADDDREAGMELACTLPADWFYVPVENPNQVERYSQRFTTTAVLLADEIAYPKGGAARLLQELIDRVGKPVIVLAGDWTPEVATKWKEMGALECVPHPTRSDQRVNRLREVIRQVVLGSDAPEVVEAPPEEAP